MQVTANQVFGTNKITIIQTFFVINVCIMFFGTSNLEVFVFHLCCLTISNTKKEPDLKSTFYLPSMWTLEDEYHCSTVLRKCGKMEQKLNSIFSLLLTIRIFSLHFSGGMNNISLLSTMCL